MERSPRISVVLTGPELQWLRWYAARTGRTPAAAAARLISVAIEGERAKPSLEAAYVEDETAWEPGPVVIADIAEAFEVPGVLQVLAGEGNAATPRARAAAFYLSQVSDYIASARKTGVTGPPPRLSSAPAQVVPGHDIGEAMAVYNGAGRPSASTFARSGRPLASDKG